MKQVINQIMHLFSNIFVMVFSVVLVASLAGFFGAKAIRTSKETKPIACNVICVSITPKGINPDTLSIKVGEFVQFNAADGKTHSMALGGGDNSPNNSQHEHLGEYESGDFAPDEAWKVQFKKSGTYKLHDHYNPKNQILVVVYQPGGVEKLKN